MNPDVTVRGRGVMEKCTYCVQRIERAAHPRRGSTGRQSRTASVTACQQACPTNAIAFGTSTTRQPQVAAARTTAPLRHAPRAEHPAAHRVPDARSRTPTRSSADATPDRPAAARRRARAAPALDGQHDDATLDRSLLAPRLGAARHGWLVAFAIARAGVLAISESRHPGRRASAPGATTSPSAGPSTSSTSSGGSVSATPGR